MKNIIKNSEKVNIFLAKTNKIDANCNKITHICLNATQAKICVSYRKKYVDKIATENLSKPNIQEKNTRTNGSRLLTNANIQEKRIVKKS